MNSNPVLKKDTIDAIKPLCELECKMDGHTPGTNEYATCYGKRFSEWYRLSDNLYRYRPYSPYYASTLSPHYKKIDMVIILIFLFALVYYYFIKK
jgi:hypothetical protein